MLQIPQFWGRKPPNFYVDFQIRLTAENCTVWLSSCSWPSNEWKSAKTFRGLVKMPCYNYQPFWAKVDLILKICGGYFFVKCLFRLSVALFTQKVFALYGEVPQILDDHFQIWHTSKHVAELGWIPYSDVRGRRLKTKKDSDHYTGLPCIRMFGPKSVLA